MKFTPVAIVRCLSYVQKSTPVGILVSVKSVLFFRVVETFISPMLPKCLNILVLQLCYTFPFIKGRIFVILLTKCFLDAIEAVTLYQVSQFDSIIIPILNEVSSTIVVKYVLYDGYYQIEIKFFKKNVKLTAFLFRSF